MNKLRRHIVLGNLSMVRHLICILTLAWFTPSIPSGMGADLDYVEDVRPLLDKHCYNCHGTGRRVKGGVNLAEFENLGSLHRDPKTWENVVRQLEERTMPPEDRPQPSEEERLQLTQWIRHTLDHPDEALLPRDPGRVVLHRLSATEYDNTVRDLFGIASRPAKSFPSEGSGGGGFDNNADTLFIPPVFMERFLEAAHQVVEDAAPDRLFLARPSDNLPAIEAARQILSHYTPLIFRRPAKPQEIDRYLNIVQDALDEGHSFEKAVKTALAAQLVSPHFLFRVEIDRETQEPYRLNDYELASRLSYFLWASMPDQRLFDLAAENKLHQPETLAQEVGRMLKDPKARVLAEKFASQWLGTEKLDTAAQPDPDRFKTYTVELRNDMKSEVIEFFHHLVQENRSILELLDADYTFLNERLAKHYEMDHVEGEEFRKVSLTDANRGGVMSMGAVLTLTSYPRRTSPVLRGKWVLEEILGTPPPPPPPLVESLPRDDRPREGLTFRQRLEKHREDPNCAVCHKKMDPLGFGLENFDAIGRWRTDISDIPIDATGVLPGGETFEGPAQLKKVLLARKDLFARNFTERMLSYALGRGLEYYDMPTVKELTDNLEAENYAIQTLIQGIARSFPFQYRRNEPITAPEAATVTNPEQTEKQFNDRIGG